MNLIMNHETRKRALKLITEQCIGAPPEMIGAWPTPEQFRCARCKSEPTCRSAWDLYNIGDDCIEEK